MQDPYAILGVARDASQDDIRSAYRKLAKQHHPDLNPGNTATEERFKTLSAANELLSDTAKRAQFDRGEIDANGQAKARGPSYRQHAEGDAGRRYSRSNSKAEQWESGDFSDLFGSMFGGGGTRQSAGPNRGRDEHYSLSAQFLDAVCGATRRLTLPDGRILDVKIPTGTTEGQVLRLRGQGGSGSNGGEAGDALIEINIAPHRYFERRGDDISLKLPLTLSEAVLGASVQVPTPAGPVMLRIQPHSDSGKEMRLKGRGVPAHDGRPAGNLYATIAVVIGPEDEALDAFLQAWKPQNPSNPRASLEDRP